MRQHTIWFTAAHQELYQIDEQLRNTMLSLGTYILGSTSSMAAARELADAIFSCDPWWVKYWRPVHALRSRWGRSDDSEPAVEPEFMPLEEQQELFAQRIKGLGRFRFLFRPAVSEGAIGSAVLSLSIRHEDKDSETEEYQFPDQHLIQRLRAALAKQSGIPIAKLLTEQEARIPPSLPETRRHLLPPQPRPTQRTTQPSTNGNQEAVPLPAAVPAGRQGRQGLPTQRRHALSQE
jgi:hypothetical protein